MVRAKAREDEACVGIDDDRPVRSTATVRVVTRNMEWPSRKN